MMEKKNFLLLTGASSGIGQQLAIKLSTEYNIVLNGRNEERLQSTRQLCSGNNEQLIFPFDLCSLEKTENAFSEFIISNNIQISHLVFCAGVMNLIPLKVINMEYLLKTFNTNVFSVVLLMKVLTNRKVNGEFLKSAVLISSNISNFGAKGLSVYGASKSALDGLMRNLAVELAPRIRINSVLPGAIQTRMTESIFNNPETIERMKATYPLGLGSIDSIGEMVSFLLSEKSSWITGQQLTVDGGRTINITG